MLFVELLERKGGGWAEMQPPGKMILQKPKQIHENRGLGMEIVV